MQGDARKGSVQIACARHIQDQQAQELRRGLDFSSLSRSVGVGRITVAPAGNSSLKHLEPLRSQLQAKRGCAHDIAAQPIEPWDQAGGD
jgi:hypothetical protein